MVAFALEREDEARKLYQNAAQDPRYSKAKELFVALSEENVRQRSAIQRIFSENIAGDGDFGSYSPVTGLERDDYAYARPTQDMSFEDFDKFAVAMEDESSRLYRDMASQADSIGRGVVRAFERLSKEKADRKQRLQALSGS